ncbi:MAG TPA: M90 family metallopeptidase [Coleofasciculaceae cyanobacterium]
MIKALIVLGLIFLIIALILGIDPLIRWKQKRLANQPFPTDWIVILERNIPFYNNLPKTLRLKLQGYINVLLNTKQFKGCGGLNLTDEIKVTIAGIASLLLLNDQGNYYPKLRLILVYPAAFLASQTTPIGDQYLKEQQVKSGESWGIGVLVLSWQTIRYDVKHWQDGRNVILHEFAHQLDQEGGRASGVPILEKRSDYVTWARVFQNEYEQLCRDIQRGLPTIIDEYGATDPAEFFAVATETFFEKPLQMQRQHPELYNILKHYYKLDPGGWMGELS